MEPRTTFSCLLIVITVAGCGATEAAGQSEELPFKEALKQIESSNQPGQPKETLGNQSSLTTNLRLAIPGVQSGSGLPQAASTRSCDSIYTSGAKVQTWVNGQYTKVSGTCNSRPVFTQSGTSQGTIYLYFWQGGINTYAWVFGDMRCGEEGYAMAMDAATTPDSITADWHEYNYNTGSVDRNTNMRTTCSGAAGISCVGVHAVWLLLGITVVKNILW